MSVRGGFFALAAAAVLLPASLQADELKGRWSVSLQGGSDIELGGDVHNGGTGNVLGLPTSVEARSFSDVYEPSLRGQLSIGYGVATSTELYLKGSYYHKDAEVIRVGNVAGLNLTAEFDDYREWGVEAGFRRFLTNTRLKPYAGLTAGLRFLDEKPSTFRVPDANVVLSDVPFYEASTVGVFGANIGLSYDVSSRMAIGVETGPRYQTRPGRLNGLAGTGLEAVNDAGSRWSMPVLATLRFSF